MEATLQARMGNPAFGVPDAIEALQALGAAVGRAGVPPRTMELVNLRASQINGCGVCAVHHPRIARRLGETDERLWAVTRFADRHFDAQGMAALVLQIATVNLWNRLNVASRQVAGQEW